MYTIYIYDIYIYIYIYIRSLICVAFAVFECTTVPYPIYPCMVSMLKLGAGILMVNVTAYRIHWSYGYHYHHATRLQAAQEAIAQGERRKKLVQSVVGVGAGPTSQVLAKRDRSEVLMTPSTQVTPETVKKHCEGHVTPRALSFFWCWRHPWWAIRFSHINTCSDSTSYIKGLFLFQLGVNNSRVVCVRAYFEESYMFLH